MEKEQFLLFSTIFCNLILDFCVKTRARFSLRDKRLFEITKVGITRVDCNSMLFVRLLFGMMIDSGPMFYSVPPLPMHVVYLDLYVTSGVGQNKNLDQYLSSS